MKHYHQKRHSVDWGKKFFYFLFGAWMGAVVGFIVIARLHEGLLSRVTEGDIRISDVLIFTGCAVVFGLFSAVRGDDFWSRLLGR